MYQVEIRVEGNLDQRWSDWLDGLQIVYPNPDETILAGPIVDHAALYGLIAKLRDLGLSLLSFARVEPDRATVLREGASK